MKASTQQLAQIWKAKQSNRIEQSIKFLESTVTVQSYDDKIDLLIKSLASYCSNGLVFSELASIAQLTEDHSLLGHARGCLIPDELLQRNQLTPLPELFKEHAAPLSYELLSNIVVRFSEYSTAVIDSNRQLRTDLSTGNCRFEAAIPIDENEIFKAAGRFIIIPCCYPNNYFHWLTEIVPLIIWIKTQSISKMVDGIILNHSDTSFQSATLAELSQDGPPFINANYFDTLAIEQAVILHPVNHYQGQCRPTADPLLYTPSVKRWACQLLKDYFATDDTERGLRFYISREFALGRKVTNEVELIAVLNDLQIKSLHLEQLTLLDQIKLFQSADLIVGGHGAGLANLVFCKPGTRVIELFAKNDSNCLYEEMAKNLQLDYCRIRSDGENLPDGSFAICPDLLTNQLTSES